MKYSIQRSGPSGQEEYVHGNQSVYMSTVFATFCKSLYKILMIGLPLIAVVETAAN